MNELSFQTIAFRAILAVVIGGFIGRERGARNQPAGIRTHSLVCLGAALIMMTNLYVSMRFQEGDPTRMGSQVVNGIGFLGAGTILVTRDNKIKGLTTAAGVWVAAAIGLAIGIGFYEGAAISGVLVWVVMTTMQSLKMYIQIRSREVELYLVVNSTEAYNRVLIYCAEHRVRILDSRTIFGEIPSDRIQHFNTQDKKIASFLRVSLKGNFEHLKLLEEIYDIPGVLYVEETQEK
ncbi:MAG: MgtC/SapB family protein [Aerococcaceae bacterium]|nr:MgtC/SapB family protein [Aerococcaceae bacterium]